MPFLELIDETLDINSTANYQLAMQVSPYELSYCILDTLRNKFVLLRSSEPEDSRKYASRDLEEIILGDNYLCRQYKKVHIITSSPKMTLVPGPLYDSDKKNEYFAFNQIVDYGDTILENKINDQDLYIVFSYPGSIAGFLNAHFPGAPLLHQTKPLLTHISGLRRSSSGIYIHVHIEKEFFNLIISDRGTLGFCNSFSYSNISDILYFVLNVFKKLGIKQEETINISGSSIRYDDLHSAFTAYVSNLRYSEPSEKYTFSYVFTEAAMHRYLNLFAAADCE